MKKLALVLFGLFLSSSVMAYTPEPRAKLLMIASASTQSASPSLVIETAFTDFNSMTECTNAVTLISMSESGYMTINGVKMYGQMLPNKFGSQGYPVTYTYRCLPFGYDNMYDYSVAK